MSGLNQVAEDFIIAKNTPEILFKELGRCYTLVYESDNRILAVGAICGSEIKRVYVDPEFQGKGIGSSIVAALEKAATSQKCKMLV